MPLFNLQKEIIENPRDSVNESNDRGASLAVPVGTLSKDSRRLVNVVSDFSWTLSPKSARKDVPYIYLIERKLNNDVMLQQLIYNLSVVTSEAKIAVEGAENAAAIKLLENGETADSATSQIVGARPKINKDLTDKIRNIVSSESPYQGLYSLKDTGWSYVLPYFDKQNHNIQGNWDVPNAKQGLGSGIIQSAGDVVGDFAVSLNRIYSALGAIGAGVQARPGTYIEQAKQYQFASTGPSYSVQFNLYNTTTVEDVIQNWELCFLMMYNILPNRRTKTAFDPPPLYEVLIPGVRRSPVTFIKGMRVDFLGATRIMDLDVIGNINGRPTGKTRSIVPDAYSITIDFEDVLPESKNFMQAMLDEDQKISVSFSNPELSVGNVETSVDAAIESKANDITYITLNGNQRRTGNIVDKAINAINESVSNFGQRNTNAVGKTKGTF